MERVVRHFQEELEALQVRLLEMGGLAEERVRAAIHGLVTRDSGVVEKVLRGDEPINELHIEIDNRCFTLLALHQPMATDLRAIVSAVKIFSVVSNSTSLPSQKNAVWSETRAACCMLCVTMTIVYASFSSKIRSSM